MCCRRLSILLFPRNCRYLQRFGNCRNLSGSSDGSGGDGESHHGHNIGKRKQVLRQVLSTTSGASKLGGVPIAPNLPRFSIQVLVSNAAQRNMKGVKCGGEKALLEHGEVGHRYHLYNTILFTRTGTIDIICTQGCARYFLTELQSKFHDCESCHLAFLLPRVTSG